LHAPGILHRAAMKYFRAIQRKICCTNVEQNRFDSILLQSFATHFCAVCDVLDIAQTPFAANFLVNVKILEKKRSLI